MHSGFKWEDCDCTWFEDQLQDGEIRTLSGRCNECERSHQISEVLLWSGIEQTTETDIRLNPRNRGSGDIRQLRLDWEQAKAKIAEHKGKYEIANMKVETFGKYTPLMPWNGDIVEVAAVQGGYMRGVWKSPQRLLRRDDCLSEACRVSP